MRLLSTAAIGVALFSTSVTASTLSTGFETSADASVTLMSAVSVVDGSNQLSQIVRTSFGDPEFNGFTSKTGTGLSADFTSASGTDSEADGQTVFAFSGVDSPRAFLYRSDCSSLLGSPSSDCDVDDLTLTFTVLVNLSASIANLNLSDPDVTSARVNLQAGARFGEIDFRQDGPRVSQSLFRLDESVSVSSATNADGGFDSFVFASFFEVTLAAGEGVYVDNLINQGGTVSLVTPAPVPLPASSVLLLSALGALAFKRRKS